MQIDTTYKRYGRRRAGISFALCWLAGLVFIGGGYSCTKKYITDPVADSLYLGRLSYVMNDNASYTNFYSALKQTGWLDTLSAPGPFTVVLPNNDAYNAGYNPQIGQAGDLSYFIAGEVTAYLPLSAWVGYDLVRGAVKFRSLPLGMNQPLPTLTGQPLYVTRYLSGKDTVTTVNGQRMVSLDNPATNGLIQVAAGIPNIQVYPTVMQQIKSDTNLVYFAVALQRAHLDTLLMGPGPFTVLAPMSRLFAAQATFGAKTSVNFSSIDSILTANPDSLRAILQYYILPGRYFINDFERQLAAPTDTLSLTMLNGDSVKFTNSAGYGYFPESMTAAPTFFGTGNLRQNLPSATIDEEQIGVLTSIQRNGADLPAANGVVHTIYFFLVP